MRWLLTLSLLSAQVHAHTVLVQAASAPNLDYRAELKAHADYVSPIDEYLATHPSSAAREALISNFGEAQSAFLSKSAEEARTAFQHVLELLTHEDWSAQDREIFLQAYLRLAQLATSAEDQDHWLSESLLLGTDVAYDATLYPPPLITRRAALATKLTGANPAMQLVSENFPVILINGIRCERKSCPPLVQVPGLLRVTWLSNRAAPRSKTLALREFSAAEVKFKPFAKGDCTEPNWSPESSIFAQKKFFVSRNCVKPSPTLELARTNPETFAAPPPLAEPEHVSLYKNKWLWIGLGVVAAGLTAIALTTGGREVKDPTTTYGR